jgi:hypothetical protein
MKVYLLSGPPRSGKNTLCEVIARALHPIPVMEYSIAALIKDASHALYSVLGGVPLDAGPRHYEFDKDDPSDDFLGLTPRQVYISLSERYIKPMHGKYLMASVLAQQIRKDAPAVAVVTDLGFPEELVAFKRYLDNVHVIQLQREGTKWDSRVPIDGQICPNNGTKEDLLRWCRLEVSP